jgi:glycosyltransferase involved in cell wall biosynthesis
MPCLNEAETLARCIGKARDCLCSAGVVNEIIVADNSSCDGSQAIAVSLDARVVHVPVQGYGSAVRAGIRAARGEYIIMGDSDDSYDFSTLMPFVEQLRAGHDLVMGNRFRGGVADGAMPWLNRYFGIPTLTFIGRMLCGKPQVGDFHCGLRAFRRDAAQRMELSCNGMEFASEIVAKASRKKMKIVEVPTTLVPAGRTRPPHLRRWRDGVRHLRFLVGHFLTSKYGDVSRRWKLESSRK